LEQAIERSKVGDGLVKDEQTALQLQELINKSQSLLSARTSDPVQTAYTPTASSNSQGLTPSYSQIGPSSSTDFSGHSAAREESFALDDAENPLQLLARASDLPSSEPLVSSQNLTDLPNQVRSSLVNYISN
jgi:hypothetical protein